MVGSMVIATDDVGTGALARREQSPRPMRERAPSPVRRSQLRRLCVKPRIFGISRRRQLRLCPTKLYSDFGRLSGPAAAKPAGKLWTAIAAALVVVAAIGFYFSAFSKPALTGERLHPGHRFCEYHGRPGL